MAVSMQRGQVAFMTTKDRELFPMKTSKDRFGNELYPLKGAPNRGPGCYDNDKKTTLVHALETKIVSTKGYTFAARTGPRLAKEVTFQSPCPAEYQRHFHDPKIFYESKKPFQIGTDRFPVAKRDLINVIPGAGTYEPKIRTNRKVQWHQSFGGAPVFMPTVALRSTIDRNTEKLYSTKEEKKYQRKLAYLKLYY